MKGIHLLVDQQFSYIRSATPLLDAASISSELCQLVWGDRYSVLFHPFVGGRHCDSPSTVDERKRKRKVCRQRRIKRDVAKQEGCQTDSIHDYRLERPDDAAGGILNCSSDDVRPSARPSPVDWSRGQAAAVSASTAVERRNCS